MDERPKVVPEMEETVQTKAFNVAMIGCLLGVVVLVVIGAVSVIGWLV